MKIINQEAIEVEAYKYGAEVASRAEGRGWADSPKDVGFDYFTETSEYVNTILPRLRKWSGYNDAGMGTYQMTDLVQCLTSDEMEELADGYIEGSETVVGSGYVYEWLVDQFSEGYFDAALGR